MKTVMLTLLLVLPGSVMAQPAMEDTAVIAYDDSVFRTWWCSDRDSFGAAVRFTPEQYPCQVVGTRAAVGYDEGCNIYLRVYDDDSTNGLPGHILYNELRSDIPHGQSPTFGDYNLTEPVTIEEGDFYICFFQKHWFHLLFGTDQTFNFPERQWWYFPDWGWVTPMGMDAADQLIRAKVIYPTGVEDELGPFIARPALVVSPNPVRGEAVLKLSGRAAERLSGPVRIEMTDASGKVVRVFGTERGRVRLDASGLSGGVYFVRAVNTELPVAHVVIAH